MKLMIFWCLCVAVCQTVGQYQREEDSEAYRQLYEGNFGLKLKASLDTATNRPGIEEQNQIQEGPPEKEYLPPESPVPKISDALAGAEHTFSSAIESHLKSPLPVYRPRLGSPTTFDALPISYLSSYSKQYKYQLPESLPFFPTFATTEGPAKLTSFPAFTQTTEKTLPIDVPGISGEFKPLPEVSQLLYQQLFSTQPDTDPRNIYHEINQLQTLSDQVSYEENVQIIRDDKENDKEYAKQVNKLSEGEGNINEGYTRRLEESTSIRPQVFSYAQFSQSLPLASREPITAQQETIELSTAQTPLTFQPTSTQVTSLPVVTTSSSRPPLFTTTQTPPPRNRVVKIGQRVTTPRSLTFGTKISPASSTTSFLTSTTPPTRAFNYGHTRPTLSTYSFPYGTRTSLFSNTVPPQNNFKASSTKLYRTTLSPPQQSVQTLSTLPIYSLKTQSTLSPIAQQSVQKPSTLPIYSLKTQSTLPPIAQQSVQTPSTLPIYSLKTESPVSLYSTPLPTSLTPSTLLLASQPDLVQTTLSPTPLSSTVIISSPSESTSQTVQQSTTPQPSPIILLSTKTDFQPQTYESTTSQPIVKIEGPRKESKLKEQLKDNLIEDPHKEALKPAKHLPEEIKQDFDLIREGPQSLNPIEQSIIIQNEETVQTIPQEIRVLDHAHTIVHPNQLIPFSPLYQQAHILQQELYQPQPFFTQYTTQTQHFPLRIPQKSNPEKQQKQQGLVKDQGLNQIHRPTHQYNPIDLRPPYLQNNLYSEEKDYYYVNPPYLPVPVGITAFSSPILQGSSGSFSQVIPPYPDHSYHDTPTAVSAVQFYSKFAPDIFGRWH